MKHALFRAVFIAECCRTLFATGVASLGAEPPAINRFRDAIRDGNTDLVRAMLVADSALANQRDGDNLCPPLYYAVTYGHTRIARLLLDHGADVDGTDRQGSTVYGNHDWRFDSRDICPAASSSVWKAARSNGAGN